MYTDASKVHHHKCHRHGHDNGHQHQDHCDDVVDEDSMTTSHGGSLPVTFQIHHHPSCFLHSLLKHKSKLQQQKQTERKRENTTQDFTTRTTMQESKYPHTETTNGRRSNENPQ